MKNKIQKLYKYFPLFIFLLYVLWIHHNVVLLDGDDIVYQQTLKNTSVLAWCKDFYKLWGGRIPLQLLDIIYLNLPLKIWKICNSIIYVLVPVYIYRIILLFKEDITDKQCFLLYSLISIFLVIMPDSIVNFSILWVTGSFNYLLPGIMLLIGLYPFLAEVAGKKVKKIDMIFAWIGVFLACYAEQTAAVFICMILFCFGYLIYKKQRIPKGYIVLAIFGLINAAIQYAAPGNVIRYDAEVLRWYQNFDMYNFFDKAMLGVIHCLKSVFIQGFPFFTILLLLLGILTLRKSYLDQLSYLFLCVITIIAKNTVNGIDDGVIWQVYSAKMLFNIAVLIFWMLFFAWYILNCLEYSKEAKIVALFFLAIFASGIVMGMSPTVFASGERVFFLSYLLLILVQAFLIKNVISYEYNNEKI